MNNPIKDRDILSGKKKIDELDLSLIAQNMVSRQAWLQSEVEEACRLYRNFLFLHYKYPNETLVPSEDIDEVWHNHILDTQKYNQDCQNLFGEFFHHDPSFGMNEKTTLLDLSNAFDRTQELHREEFGYYINGIRYTKLSRLFRRFMKLN